ncbi:hypothetical protein AB0M02_20975 [Actinoplanes sp. NPDC051861]|uniref:hypothetical protein n=1 Tax=Actinoplanes sp. NPDC051861 TaxID=3155170 RepID=UPI00341E63ED
MPTAEEFEAAAEQLEAAARTTATLIDPARATMSGNVMIGGQLTGMVTEELDAAAKLLDGVTTELTELAVTCRQRAEAARVAVAEAQAFAASYADYESDLRRWQEASDDHRADPGSPDPGPRPEPPPAP